jgi:hypothetical protein
MILSMSYSHRTLQAEYLYHISESPSVMIDENAQIASQCHEAHQSLSEVFMLTTCEKHDGKN